MVRSALVDMGPGTQPLALAKELRKRGYQVSFATSGGVVTPEVEKQGFAVNIIPELAADRHDPLSVLRAVIAIARLVRRERVDLIHGHNGAATLCAWMGGLLSGRLLPAVTSIRGVEERDTHQHRNRIWRYLPGKLLAVCENGRQRLTAFGVPASRIQVTYNGVDLDRFSPSLYDPVAVRRELGLEDALVIGCTGAMVGLPEWEGPSKGQHLLVSALARLHERYPQVRVMLIGDGPMREVVERRAAEHGIADKVLFLGRRFDVPRLLSAVDIYCLPSIKGEFFPNSILEAMAMGIPWVGSDIAGLSELTAENEAGVVVPVGDVDLLTAELERLIVDAAARKRMGRRARLEVEQRFTVEKVVDRVLAAYDVGEAR